MNKNIKKILLVGLLLLLYPLFTFKEAYLKINIELSFQSDQLKGGLVVSKEKYQTYQETSLVIFVHGEGELDKTAYGYYKPRRLE